MRKLLLALALLTSITANAREFVRSCALEENVNISITFAYNSDGLATMMIEDGEGKTFTDGVMSYKNPFSGQPGAAAMPPKFRFYSNPKDILNSKVMATINIKGAAFEGQGTIYYNDSQTKDNIICQDEFVTKK